MMASCFIEQLESDKTKNYFQKVLKENLDLTEFWKNVDVLQRKYFEIPRVQIQAVLLHFRNNLRFADFVLDSKKLVRFVTHLPPKKRVSKLVSLLEKNLNQKLHLKNINCANKSSNRLIYKKELYQPLKLSVFDYSNYREIMRKNLKKHLSKSKVQYLYKSAFEKLHVGRKFFERNNYAQTKPLLSKQTGKGRSILKGFLERTQTSLLKNYFNESDLINKNIYSTFKNISLNSGVVVKTKRESMTTAKLLIEKEYQNSITCNAIKRKFQGREKEFLPIERVESTNRLQENQQKFFDGHFIIPESEVNKYVKKCKPVLSMVNTVIDTYTLLPDYFSKINKKIN